MLTHVRTPSGVPPDADGADKVCSCTVEERYPPSLAAAGLDRGRQSPRTVSESTRRHRPGRSSQDYTPPVLAAVTRKGLARGVTAAPPTHPVLPKQLRIQLRIDDDDVFILLTMTATHVLPFDTVAAWDDVVFRSLVLPSFDVPLEVSDGVPSFHERCRGKSTRERFNGSA